MVIAMKGILNYKMTPKEFFRKIIGLYFEFRKPKLYDLYTLMTTYLIGIGLSVMNSASLVLRNRNSINFKGYIAHDR